MRMRVHKSTCARRKHKDAPKERMKNEWNKWKNHFYEMKGDVGMSLHEKEDAYTKTQSHSYPHPYIFVSSKTTTYIFMQAIGCQDVVLFALPNAFITNKQTNNMLKQNKDVGMGL